MREDIKQALVDLQHPDGTLNPDDIISAARSRSSVLHDQFEWDDKAAAHQHRIDQARELIREFRVVVKVMDTTHLVNVKAYTRDPDAGQTRQYVSVDKLKNDRRRQLMALIPSLKRSIGELQNAYNTCLYWGVEAKPLLNGLAQLRGFLLSMEKELDEERAAAD